MFFLVVTLPDGGPGPAAPSHATPPAWRSGGRSALPPPRAPPPPPPPRGPPPPDTDPAVRWPGASDWRRVDPAARRASRAAAPGWSGARAPRSPAERESEGGQEGSGGGQEGIYRS
eukprot:287363-Prorocentrum_minimum.AAC.1